MLSRLAAPFLKPAFAILAALAVGGAWGAGWWQSGSEWDSCVWDGNSSEYFIASWADVALSFSGQRSADNNVRIGNNDYASADGHIVTFSAASESDNDGLSITGSLNVGENGDQGILKITSGRYTASTGLFVSGGSSRYGSLIMDGGYLDVTGEVQFGNAENSICTNYINAGATIANNSYFCVGRAAGTDTYLEVNGGTVQTTGTLTIGTCGSEASKGVMVVKSGTVTANYIKVGEFDTATLTISGGNVTGTTGLMLADAAPDNTRTWNTEGFTANEKATLNLDGGVLTAPSIVRGNGAGSGNTYVNFNGGTLAASAAGTLIGSGLTVTIGSNGGTIDVGANNVTIAASVTGSGAIIKKGSGTLTLSGDLTGFTGKIQVCGGSVIVPSASSTIVSGPSTIKTVVDNTTVFTLVSASVLNLDFEDELNYDANWSFSGSANQHSQGTRSDNNTSYLKLYGNGAGAGGTRTTLAKYSAIPQVSGSYNVILDWYARVGYHNSTCYVKLLNGTTSLFSIEAPNVENQQYTTAYVYGNPKGEALGSFTVAARNTNIDSDSSYWYTVRVDVDVTKGVLLTVLKPDKTVVFGPTVVSEYLAVTGIEVQQESAKGVDAHGGIDNICITVPAKAMFGFGGYKTLQDAINEASASLESTKTVTLLDNVTEDITLSTPGTVVSLGSFVITGTVSAGSGMVVTYDDVAKTWTCEADTSTYTWTNEKGNNLWSDPGNWLAGSAVATAAPTPEKLIVFPATEGSWSVILAENASVASVQFNGNTTLSGGLIVSDVITAADGVVVTLGEGGGFMESTAEITIAVNIAVAGTQAAPSVLRGYSHINTYSGNLTGSGWIELQAHNDLSGIKMTGNNSAFSGTVVVPAAEQSAKRTACGVTPSASSANATFIISGAGKWNENKERSSFLKGSNGTYYFGSIVGTLLADSTQQRNNTVYVGYLNSNSDSVAGHLAYESGNHDRGQTFHKVGTGTMTYTATRAYSLYLDDGTLNMAVADPLVYSSIVFNGGELKLAEACTTDLSSKFEFVADKTATIDDGGVPRTFATAIGSSVAANFTKKGSGTLTLSQPPTYTGTTKVEAGVLYIVEGYSPTLAAGTVEMVSDKTGYKKYVPAAAAVAHVGNVYYPTFAEAWAAAGNDDNAAWIYLDAAPAQDDVVTLTDAWQRVRVVNGTYSAEGHIAISGSLANVALKTSLGAEMTEYTACPTVTVTVVPGTGVASGEIAAGYISKDGAVYTIYSGSEVTITWTAAEGYEFAGGESTATTVISPTGNVTPECPAATEVVVGSVSISAPVVGAYGNDFATVSVTAGVTSTYPAATEITYTLKANGTAIASTKAAGNATSVTFDNANVSGLSRYGNISYTVEASGDNVTAATSAATTAMLADAEGWIDEKKLTTGTTGSWKTADGAAATVTYDNETERAELSDNKFSANNCSTGDVVTVTIKDVIYTALSDTSAVDADAQGSIALGGTESAPKFMVLTKSGNVVQWSEATGVDPALNTSYTIVFTFDYNNNKYSITVNGAALTVGGSATYDIVKTTNKYVKDIDFLGAGSIKAIEGIQYDAMMAVDQNGDRYATVAAALDANKGVKGAVIKLLHGTANTNIAGWNYNADTKTFIKKAVGLIFLAF